MRPLFVFCAIVAALAAAIFHLPLGWVAPKFVPEVAGKNLTYSGTIWRGEVSGVDLLGRANFQLSPQNLTSKLPLALSAGNGRNVLRAQMGRRHIKDLRLVLQTADLPLPDQRLKGLQGQVDLSVDEASFDQRCFEASGKVWTDILQQNAQKFAWSGPRLEGPIRCEGGNVIFELAGRDQLQSITAKITVDPAGIYAADITVQSSQAEARAVLPLFGFSQADRGFKLTEKGKWR